MGPIRNTEQQLDHIYYTRFCMSTTTLAAPFTNPGNLGNYVEPKSFFPHPNLCTQVGLSSSNFSNFTSAGSHTERALLKML
jgi:hypothetical protein